MDALSFNPLQNAVAATAGIATDAALPDGTSTGIDFSALLALGLNPDAQDVSLQYAPGEPQMTPEIAAGVQESLPNPELFIALPQQLPNVDAAPATTTTPDALAADAKAGPTFDAAPASTAAVRGAMDTRTRGVDSTTAAVVADKPANIAADIAQPTEPMQPMGQTQNVDQRVDATANSRQEIMLETSRAIAAEATPRAEPLTHAVHVHPAEGRAPAPQPSALLEVQAPVSEPGFAQALSRQVVWMVDKDAQIAELRIHPPELGPVEVRLTLSQDGAAAEFVSPHAEVRAAIENALVRLRESMAEAGIQLGETSVSAESFSDRPDAKPQSRNAREGYREAPFADHGAPPSSGSRRLVGHGLVDVFA